MQDTLVILVVGLTPSLVGPHTPHLEKLAKRGAMRPLSTPIPAVTCTSQSTLVTGLPPSGHGAVANGWFFRDACEVDPFEGDLRARLPKRLACRGQDREEDTGRYPQRTRSCGLSHEPLR